ncbi:hypothetical protein EYC84_011994 [Monilinia fructicola]|uniref:Uncharacterized protein n=1 Tax=Monilinia fructicola TaxID=38448 RepID=A0A5M9J9N5_MONFR|nr:hypothetical protein EYC84_011994 [Monilinia fructicola]
MRAAVSLTLSRYWTIVTPPRIAASTISTRSLLPSIAGVESVTRGIERKEGKRWQRTGRDGTGRGGKGKEGKGKGRELREVMSIQDLTNIFKDRISQAAILLFALPPVRDNFDPKNEKNLRRDSSFFLFANKDILPLQSSTKAISTYSDTFALYFLLQLQRLSITIHDSNVPVTTKQISPISTVFAPLGSQKLSCMLYLRSSDCLTNICTP